MKICPNPEGHIKEIENDSLTGYNKSHKIHFRENPQTPTLPENIFTLSQSGHLCVKKYNR